MLFLGSRVLSTLALHMQTVAVGWQLYALTGSAFDLGLVGLVQFAPTIVLTLVVGQVADRYDRRFVVAICHVAGQCQDGRARLGEALARPGECVGVATTDRDARPCEAGLSRELQPEPPRATGDHDCPVPEVEAREPSAERATARCRERTG